MGGDIELTHCDIWFRKENHKTFKMNCLMDHNMNIDHYLKAQTG